MMRFNHKKNKKKNNTADNDYVTEVQQYVRDTCDPWLDEVEENEWMNVRDYVTIHFGQWSTCFKATCKPVE